MSGAACRGPVLGFHGGTEWGQWTPLLRRAALLPAVTPVISCWTETEPWSHKEQPARRREQDCFLCFYFQGSHWLGYITLMYLQERFRELTDIFVPLPGFMLLVVGTERTWPFKTSPSWTGTDGAFCGGLQVGFFELSHGRALHSSSFSHLGEQLKKANKPKNKTQHPAQSWSHRRQWPGPSQGLILLQLFKDGHRPGSRRTRSLSGMWGQVGPREKPGSYLSTPHSCRSQVASGFATLKKSC